MAKVALITGAGVGIGKGVALEMARAGYDIALHYNGSKEQAQAVQQEILALGPRCEILGADLTDLAGLRGMFRAFEESFGRLDVFVGNAGLTLKGCLEDMEERDFDLMCALNWKGNYFGIQEAANLMKRQGTGGSIVLISSNHAFMQHPLCSCYGALKAALNKLCKSAGVELGKYGVRVNAIAPGWTDTGAQRLGAPEDSYYHIPLRRWCTPQEVGQAALFLSGPWAGSITGITLTMDGGASLQTDSLDKYGYGAQ